MRDTDLQPFAEMLDAVCGLLSRGNYAPNAANTALWFRALREHSIEVVRAGFDAHVRDPQRGRYVPTPADVIAQIEGTAATDGRPGAEEAWAIALRARDEADTVVWTREIAEALGIARPILDMGDEVGARMAFRESYARLVDGARRQHMPVSWDVSLGFDPQRRDEAVRAAVEAGRLPMTALPAPASNDVPLLTLADSPRVPEHVREELRRLSESLRAGMEKPGADALARAETADRKAEALRRTAEYARQHAISMQCQQPNMAPDSATREHEEETNANH